MHKEIEIPEGYEAKIEDNKVIIKPIDSEDERIRKRLVKYFKFYQSNPDLTLDVNTWQGEKVSDILAYLEKQQPAEWSDEDEGMLNCIIATLCEEFHGGREANDKMVVWLENRLKSLRPQPKAEWSEEDKSILNNIIAYKYLNIDDLEWLKSLPDRFSLQPKQEWSEEDKRAIDRACVALRAYSNGNLPEFLPSELLGYADRLQSLLLQPHWKPSEKKQKQQNDVPSRETILGIWELGNFWKENPEERNGLTQLQYIQKYWFEKCDYLKEQQPAEWSEEDEKHKQAIIDAIQIVMAECGDAESIEKYQKDINWLELFYHKFKNS